MRARLHQHPAGRFGGAAALPVRAVCEPRPFAAQQSVGRLAAHRASCDAVGRWPGGSGPAYVSGVFRPRTQGQGVSVLGQPHRADARKRPLPSELHLAPQWGAATCLAPCTNRQLQACKPDTVVRCSLPSPQLPLCTSGPLHVATLRLLRATKSWVRACRAKQTPVPPKVTQPLKPALARGTKCLCATLAGTGACGRSARAHDRAPAAAARALCARGCVSAPYDLDALRGALGTAAALLGAAAAAALLRGRGRDSLNP